MGYDPYDALKSPLARAVGRSGKLARTVMIQAVKRAPVNPRPLLGIKKDLNPKAIALAARALALLIKNSGISLNQSRMNSAQELKSDFDFLMMTLGKLRSRRHEQACWGYNFDWQSRAFFAPRDTPNVVCTVFAAQAHLDQFEATQEEQALDVAKSSARFLLDALNRTESREGHCFSYTPLDRSRVHNVNLLAAELLARLYGIERAGEYFDAASRATSYTVARQHDDGSWPYGEAGSQQWIDSFHTGFIIVSLKNIIRDLGVNDWRQSLTSGYEFYRDRFFLADSTPKYYHDKLYPVDAHAAAQAVITFVETQDVMPEASLKATRAVEWAIREMQDPAGYFYFQRQRFYTIKIPYMRWAQAWMLYALSLYYTGVR
ncbi:MAG TPA: hypothetical protein VKA70_03340 [Blastocatellia bacterium]|nr:hypothetical protein [Blastocatellia bacterium]